MLDEPVNDRIRFARLAAGMTQQQLGDTIGADRIQIVHWEGRRSRPILRIREALAAATGFPVKFFDHDGRDGQA